MSWKCVLVGLALVLPGTLLVVEGRHRARDTGREKRSLLSELRDVLGEEAGADTLGRQKKDEAGTSSTGSSDRGGHQEPVASPLQAPDRRNSAHTVGSGGSITSSVVFIMIVSGCSVLAAVGIIMAGVCWYKYHKGAKAASQVEYPAYGVTGPTKDRLPSPGDRKLAQSAQMYHYQHQKQQMIAMEKANGDMKHDASDDDSEEDNVEGDYTVYECPGLAPTGEMEVKNPLFRGDETPGTPGNDDQQPGSGN